MIYFQNFYAVEFEICHFAMMDQEVSDWGGGEGGGVCAG